MAEDYDLSTTELRAELQDDETLHVDANGELLYIDPRPPGEPAAPDGSETAGESTGESPPEAPPTTDPVFLLHSRPGADHTIYLDFDGNTTSGTSWNSAYQVDPIVSPPYDISGDPESWSSSELSRIAAVWDRVAEDFSPFDVDVTTQEPDVEALRRTSGADGQWGTRIVVTDDTFAGCGCGGHAYIGSFDDPTDEPVFVYNSSLVGVAEASSHEVGHALLLAHDGTSSSSYYTGHGSGATGWAPLMGASYSRPVTQWSAGEYLDANNNTSSANYGNGPDDLAVIANLNNGNGFGYRPDDHGDTTTGATALTAPDLAAAGVVERTDDVDVFSFTTSGGPVAIDIDAAADLPNLDIRAQLLDSGGSPVADSNDSGSLAAGFDQSLTGGTYFVTVDGTGVGAPSVDPTTGFTEYGSIGQYTISGTANVVVDSAVPTAQITSPADQGTFAGGAVVTADYSCADEPGGSGLDTCTGPVADGDPIDTSTVGPHTFTVTATDYAGNTATATHTYTVVDGTDPTATITTPADNDTFVIGDEITADYSCADEPGGSGLDTCTGTTPDGDPIDTSTYGPKSFSLTATDNAGNTATVTHTYTVVDGTDPTATITTPADNDTFVIGDEITADYDCADEPDGSGLDTCTGPVADGDPIDTSTVGPQTFTVTATDNAGNTATTTHTYTVVDGTDPTATITTPADNDTFVIGDEITADYDCADEPDGSGLDTCTGPVADGDPIDTSTVGPQTFTVTATDNAGNTATSTHTYTVEPIPDHGFSDVASWLDESVGWLVYRGYATGYPDSTFRPDTNITRGQLANMVHGIAGSPPPGPGCGDLTDVPAWARDGICWLVNNGHATGYPDSTFRPNTNITRGQLANMVHGIAGSPPPGPGCGDLTDVPAWARDGICWLVNNGHATGYPDSTFRPNTNITRGQTANTLFSIHG